MSERHKLPVLPGANQAGDLTEARIREHLGALIKEARRIQKISAEELMEALDVSTRKSLWAIETGVSWPRKERVKRLEERLGFKPGILNSFFVLQGSAADIEKVTLDDLMEGSPSAAQVGFDDVSDAALIKELFERLQAKDKQIGRLTVELAEERGSQNFFDLAADSSSFKAALEAEARDKQ